MGLASQLAAAASAAGTAAVSGQKYNTPAVPPANNLFNHNQGFNSQQGFNNPQYNSNTNQYGYQPQHAYNNSQQTGNPSQQSMPGSFNGSMPQQNAPPVGGGCYTTPYNSPVINTQNGPFSGIVADKLRASVRAKNLDVFYPPERLDQIVRRAGSVDFPSLASRWQMPVEMALEMSTLALYDIVVYADDSGSMQFAENGSRIDDLREILAKVSEVATLFDEDGILIRFMNSDIAGNGIKTAADAASLLRNIRFDGTTPLGSALESKIVRPLFINNMNNLQKPILVIAITDGEPSEDSRIIKRVITDAHEAARRSRYGPGAIAFEFAQVGKDARAQQFLASLDNDPQVGQIIDATSYYELEAEEFKRKGMTLTPSLWLVKLMVGAIDPDKDRHD